MKGGNGMRTDTCPERIQTHDHTVCSPPCRRIWIWDSPHVAYSASKLISIKLRNIKWGAEPACWEAKVNLAPVRLNSMLGFHQLVSADRFMSNLLPDSCLVAYCSWVFRKVYFLAYIFLNFYKTRNFLSWFKCYPGF